jgi:hypothetical protein
VTLTNKKRDKGQQRDSGGGTDNSTARNSGGEAAKKGREKTAAEAARPISSCAHAAASSPGSLPPPAPPGAPPQSSFLQQGRTGGGSSTGTRLLVRRGRCGGRRCSKGRQGPYTGGIPCNLTVAGSTEWLATAAGAWVHWGKGSGPAGRLTVRPAVVGDCLHYAAADEIGCLAALCQKLLLLLSISD